MDNGFVCLIKKKGKFYTGGTTDLPNRMRQHGSGKPLYQEGPMSKAEALRKERSWKDWSRKKKLELIEKASLQQG
jgi:predicted GIY-YIG superfamily endonuclease